MESQIIYQENGKIYKLCCGILSETEDSVSGTINGSYINKQGDGVSGIVKSNTKWMAL